MSFFDRFRSSKPTGPMSPEERYDIAAATEDAAHSVIQDAIRDLYDAADQFDIAAGDYFAISEATEAQGRLAISACADALEAATALKTLTNDLNLND